ncbi:MAG: SPOR domain-containing protein, partial [Acidobacteriota bacterium]
AEERASVEDGVSGELAEVEVLQVDESEESVAVEGVLTDLPEEPLGSLPSTPDSVTPVALEESGIEDQNEPTGPVDSDEALSPPREASGPNGFTVQIGAFGTEVAARQLLLQLSNKRYTGTLEPPGTRPGFYRVSVGNLTSKNEASELQTRLTADGFPTFIRQVSGR